MKRDRGHSKNQTRGNDAVKNKFNFLPDDPVTDDQFGSHKKVADSIANQIESGGCGVTIGLEGTWGSGKSSIILMLQERWKEREDIQVFTFDAWEHQGDPLKRAFLEELTTNLQSNSKEGEAWLSSRPGECTPEYEKCENCGKRLKCRPDEIRDELRLRREHDTIASEPTVTDWGKAFAVATLAMPIGVALLAAAPKLTSWYFWLGTILASSPLIIIAACIVYRSLKKDHTTNLLGEFVGKTREVTKRTTQRGVDPTSIEFREYYWEILGSALRNNSRKLVIVVDNLDRVESQVALSIWGTMQIFLEARSSRESKIADRIWLVVPYDTSSVEKLWDDRHKGMGRAFKQKSFQVNYRVAAPLASRWEDYFKERLIEAIPEQELDTYHHIYHIFRIQALPAYGRQLPTPREMKLFINRMVAIANQHYPDVPLEETALYGATELAVPQALENLVGYQSDQVKPLTDFMREDWKHGLAAIHFGVSREAAKEVLYEPLIRKSLSQGAFQDLKCLLENPGAAQCCERYLRNVAPGMSTREVLIASAAFSHYSPQEARWHIQRSVRCLARRIANSEVSDWKFPGVLNEQNADDVIRLVNFENSILESVKRRLSIEVTHEELSKITDIGDKIVSWAKGAVKIVHHLSSQENVDSTLRLEMPTSEIYLKILDAVVAEPNGKASVKFFCPAEGVLRTNLKDYLAKIQRGEIRPTDLDIIRGMLQMSCLKQEHMEQIASSLESAMSPTLRHDRVEYVLTILCEQKKNPIFEQKLRNMGQNGRIFEVLHQHHGQHSCAAMCLGTIFIYHPSPEFESGHVATSGQQKYLELLSNPDQNVAKNVAKHCMKFDWLKDITQSVENTQAARSECMKAIFQHLAAQDTSGDYLNTDRFIKCHSLILEHLDSDEDEQGNRYETLVDKLLRKKEQSLFVVLEEDQTNIEYAHAYYVALQNEDLDTSSLARKLSEDLKRRIDKDQWLEQLRNENWMLDVVIELVNQEYTPNLDNKFVDALIEHAALLLKKRIKVERLGESWPQLLDGLSDAERPQFRRRLADTLSEAQKAILPLIDLYKDELETAIENADRSAKKRFLSQACMQIADRRKSDELRWMITLFHKYESLIECANRTDKEGLRNRLEDFLKKQYAKCQQTEAEVSKTTECDSTVQEWSSAIEGVAKQLGVKLVSETQQESRTRQDSNG